MFFLLPEIILLSTSLIVLTYDFIKIVSNRLRLIQITLFGLGLSFLSIFFLAAMKSDLFLVLSNGQISFFDNFYWVDLFSLFFKGLFLILGIFIVMMNIDYFEIFIKKNEAEFYFLFLTSILGLMLVTSSPNLLLIYLGLEIVGQTSYLLAGWQKNAKRSSEASLKYFLFGAVSSAVFLYGISLFYGLSGSLDLSRVVTSAFNSPLYTMAVTLIVLGFGFKISMAPMQFWCPDVYEGAPTPVTAYLSVGPKAAGFAVLLRFLGLLRIDLVFLFAILSVLTMTWGNLVALRQKNIKRLLAYSSIAQAGYILIGLVSPGLGYSVVLYYLLAYIFANLGIFAIVIYLSIILKNEDIESYAGFARRSPALAAALAVFLFSLIGVPPLAGFVGKFLIFRAAIGAGFLWLAVLGVINSVVSVYYYLNILQIMYFKSGDESPVVMPLLINLVVWACFAATIIFGVFPNLFLR